MDASSAHNPPTSSKKQKAESKSIVCEREEASGSADTGARPGLPCLVPACSGRSRPVEAGSGPHCGAEFGWSRTRYGSSGGEEEGGGARSGPGADRTILLLHFISVCVFIIARPFKQPLMVHTFLKVYAGFIQN